VDDLAARRRDPHRNGGIYAGVLAYVRVRGLSNSCRAARGGVKVSSTGSGDSVRESLRKARDMGKETVREAAQGVFPREHEAPANKNEPY